MRSGSKAAQADVVTVMFLIKKTTVKQLIGDQLYTLILKGNEVVQIDPRAHYRYTPSCWRNSRRFIYDQAIEW